MNKRCKMPKRQRVLVTVRFHHVRLEAMPVTLRQQQAEPQHHLAQGSRMLALVAMLSKQTQQLQRPSAWWKELLPQSWSLLLARATGPTQAHGRLVRKVLRRCWRPL